MNIYGLTTVSARVPESCFRVMQAAAAREGLVLPVWVRVVLYRAAGVTEELAQGEQSKVDGSRHLAPSRRSILAFLNTHGGYQSTSTIQTALKLSRPTVYGSLADMCREGLIERGENQYGATGSGAPCKTYTITPLGQSLLAEVREAAQKEMDALNARTMASAAKIGALTVSVPEAQAAPHPTPDETYRPQVHAGLRYVAMSLLGRGITSDKDLEWAKAKHASLCAIADTDVREGKSTYAAFLKTITDKIEALGGTRAIAERFG